MCVGVCVWRGVCRCVCRCEPLALGSDAVDSGLISACCRCCRSIITVHRQSLLAPVNRLLWLDALRWVQVLRTGVQGHSIVVRPFVFLPLVLAVHFNLRLHNTSANIKKRSMVSSELNMGDVRQGQKVRRSSNDRQ